MAKFFTEDDLGLDDDPVPQKQLTLAPTLSGELFLHLVQYPIVVEMWEKVNPLGSSQSGRKKRAWLAAFTERERHAISRWHQKFRDWYLVKGTPQRIQLRLSTLTLLQKAVHFFATI